MKLQMISKEFQFPDKIHEIIIQDRAQSYLLFEKCG